MSILTFGLGPSGSGPGGTSLIFGKEVTVELETVANTEVKLQGPVSVELETAQNIDVDLDSKPVDIELNEQELKIDKSCPQP